jgi:hypothetical protein|nr:MAG TPA: hypothetical protein [Caudoviricetes sp.]
MKNKIVIPSEIHQGEVKHLYAIVAYKQPGQEKLLIAKTPYGEARCVSVERSEIQKMFDSIRAATPRDITLVLTKFVLREDVRAEQGQRIVI